jgi:hypothetical protein
VDVAFDQHTIEVTRPAGTDGLGRQTGSARLVFDGEAEIQEQAVTRTTAEGSAVRIGDAQGFTADVSGFEPGDEVTVTRPDGTSFDATVAEVTPLDNSFVLTKDR